MKTLNFTQGNSINEIDIDTLYDTDDYLIKNAWRIKKNKIPDKVIKTKPKYYTIEEKI